LKNIIICYAIIKVYNYLTLFVVSKYICLVFLQVLGMSLVDQLKQKYPSNEGYVFKSCSKEWIVILQKLEDTKNNELRDGVKDSMYAKFRANKLFVVNIVHKFDNSKVSHEIKNSEYADKTIVYKIWETNEVLNFDENLNKVYAPGIHYFKNPEAAFYYELKTVKNGLCKGWYANGKLWYEYAYKDGQLDGEYKQWYASGKLMINCTYKDGKCDNSNDWWYEESQSENHVNKNKKNYKIWYDDEQHKIICTMVNGKKNGLCKEWYKDNHLKVECTYKDGKLDGLYKEWYNNGQLLREYTYREGNRDGLYKRWNENGQLEVECIYENGKKNGLYKEWYNNGQLLKKYAYREGNRDGLYKRWHENGQLDVECIYENGDYNETSIMRYVK
jgi:antitoxin component YwqK of YwqJK toxin-antitoxin module